MKIFKKQFRWVILGAAAMAGSSLLQAADPMQVQWTDVCRVTRGREIDVKTASGDEVKGLCVSITVDEISVRTSDGKVVKLGRSAMRLLRMRRAKSHQLRAWGRGMNHELRSGVDLIFSPMAPAGLVAVPMVAARGAIALPFCALSDLHDKIHGSRELRVM